MANVLISGASRGIGLALARRFVGRGDRVIAACREESKELQGLDLRVESGIDVTSEQAVRGLADRLAEEQLDVLVLNAGVMRGDDLDGVRVADVEAQLAVNAIGALRVAQALRPRLRRGGKVAAITSRMGSMADNASGGYYGYRMSKAALNALAVSLARDLRVDGVAVAVLHPGYVKTGMTNGAGNVTSDQSAAMLVERIDALTLENSGTFWHANGEVLPW